VIELEADPTGGSLLFNDRANGTAPPRSPYKQDISATIAMVHSLWDDF
jgi:hypothetical protein